MELFENAVITISLDPEVPCLEWVAKDFLNSKQFRESELKSLEFYRQYKLQHPELQWFVDARNIGPISPRDTEWVAEEILPQFAKAGLRKEAFVIPESALGKLVLKNYRAQSGLIIEIKAFTSAQKAKDWLKG